LGTYLVAKTKDNALRVLALIFFNSRACPVD